MKKNNVTINASMAPIETIFVKASSALSFSFLPSDKEISAPPPIVRRTVIAEVTLFNGNISPIAPNAFLPTN